MFSTGDRVRFPDPRLDHALAEGTFVEYDDQPIEIKARVGGVPSRFVASAWVRRDDGTTERVIAAWVQPA
jgi:hypothetical protein